MVKEKERGTKKKKAKKQNKTRNKLTPALVCVYA